MTIWSLTIDTEAGLSTSIHPTEQRCYQHLLDLWFPEDQAEYAEDRAAALDAIAQGIQPCIAWFTGFFERTGSVDNYAVDRHDPEWCIDLDKRAADNVRAALRVYQYATDDAIDAVPADLFPGHARLLDIDIDALCVRFQEVGRG
jgi:hypothetical protein